ncbi:helix-turn-helix domain-containing protein [Nocardioides sp. Leaf307]|uniref:helix-turn-helix domain-containing protein n=1 Tax=Nocardioides sp. Leaf307 TaxID=1736331 RepID=UPI000702C93E|nr:helix-turn-helix domain-containing protein [Nocardioides sp. Leaf307]KQQ41383.1 hypothetical protein ASF50_10165 [Nocardioides sp. Leaf307]
MNDIRTDLTEPAEGATESLAADGHGAAPRTVEVRRNGVLAGAIGGVAALVAAAYLARATATGAALDWVLCVVMALVAVGHALVLRDARTPLFVADDLGVRLRTGRTWRGLPWTQIEAVEVLPRRRVVRDGAIDVLAGDDDPISVPLSVSTRVVGVEPGATVVDALDALAGGAVEVVEIEGYEYLDDEAWAAVHDGDPATGPTGYADAAEAAEAAAGTAAPAEADADAERAVAQRVTTEQPPAAGTDEVPAATAPPAGADDTAVRPAVGASAAAYAPSDGDRLAHEGTEEDAGRSHDPRPALAQAIGDLASRLPWRRERATDGGPADGDSSHDAPAGTGAVRGPGSPVGAPVMGRPEVTPSATPSPLREPVVAVRSEIRTDLVHGANALDLADDESDDHTRRGLPEARELRRSGSVSLVEDTVVWGDRVSPIATAGDAVAPIVIDDLGAEPAEDPVIGPELAAARTRLGLSVDQLAERTRIRPHVIESIEVDDFAPCGGDFYARGHLRTLARVLGVDVAPLLADYDARYADAPINPRRVFEAELGAGGAIRGTRGGPNWSIMIAAVMALVLCWSVARLVMDQPVDLRDPAPNLPAAVQSSAGARVPVTLTAAGGGATVWVRDGDNELVFKGTLTFGQVKVIDKVSQPVRVQSSDGSVEVAVDGQDRGALGATGKTAQDTFTVED